MKWRVIDMTIDEAGKIKTVVENKDYIVQLVNTVAKTLIEAFENLKIEDVNMFQLGYNKAIDDCLILINANRTKFRADICYSDLYDSIVQLKAGGGNGS